jgi:uridylate kinase
MTKTPKKFTLEDIVRVSDLRVVVGGGPIVRGYDPANKKEIVGG